MRIFAVDGVKQVLRPFVRLFSLVLLLGFVLRVVLLLNGQTVANFSVANYISIFALGILNDACVGIVSLAIIWLHTMFVLDAKYSRPWGYLIFGFFVVAFLYVLLFHTIFDEYGSAAPLVAKALLGYKAASFGLRLFLPSIRRRWSQIVLIVLCFAFAALMLLNSVSEYLFWDEFGVRYNFIAVDYLVYTNEVVGNIMESYPVALIASVLVTVSAAIAYFALRPDNGSGIYDLKMRPRLAVVVGYLGMAALSLATLNAVGSYRNPSNTYVGELSANGIYKFCLAYRSSSLDYDQFYTTLDKHAVVSLLNDEYDSKGQRNVRKIDDPIPEARKNIVLITVESLSASFLAHFGNTEQLTPNIDSLMAQSMYFSNLFANGNRSVRGLEAVTLCIPPSPGESIIKRKNNANLFSTASVLRQKGYTAQYLYGGDSYFDNMKSFFSGNGYEIIDKSNILSDSITFSNIWGVCDEDLFAQAIRTFNGNAQQKLPFFAHIMTVSNHRPFTYPDGRIDIPSSEQSRSGGVKYTDYAIGRFFAEAARQPWFKNTVFVVTADHCASSAGKVELPVDRYHIPAFVYAPGFIKPSEVSVLASQADLMPTVFGLLHFDYESRFYGSNVLDSSYTPRAFLATYQNLGYWQDSILTVLSPIRRVEQFKVSTADGSYKQSLLPELVGRYKRQAVANYQSIDYWF